MLVLVGSQIWWTWEVEDTFRKVAEGNKYAMKELEARLTGQLNDLVAMVRDKLDKITRKKVNTLLILILLILVKCTLRQYRKCCVLDRPLLYHN